MLATLLGGEYIQYVGALTIKGADAEKDLDPLLEKACRSGVGPACVWLAWRTDRFSEERTAARKQADIVKTRDLFARACDSGWGDGCLALGKSYEEAGGHERAVRAWEKACSLGLHLVCDELKDMRSKPATPRGSTR
jgi:hypothetical protein